MSIEYPKKQIAQRMLSSEAGIDTMSLRIGKVRTKAEAEHLAGHAGTLASMPLYVSDIPRLTTNHVRAQIEKVDKPALVVVDSLHMMQPLIRGETREREVSEIVRELKIIARELHVPILATGALNRGPIQRGPRDRRPRLEDMRDSGAIEDEADVVLLLHREEVYDRASPDAGTADLIIAKQRVGPTAYFKLRFFADCGRFADLADDEAGYDPETLEALQKILEEPASKATKPKFKFDPEDA
jgi:replicative DNA helicase